MRKLYLFCSTLILSCFLGLDTEAGVYDLGEGQNVSFGNEQKFVRGVIDPDVITCDDVSQTLAKAQTKAKRIRSNSGVIFTNQEVGCQCDRSSYPQPYREKASMTLGKVQCCKDSGGIYCGYVSCVQGYKLQGGKCEPDCAGYTYMTAEIPGCGKAESCANSGETKYRCIVCSDGWKEDTNGGCVPRICDPDKYPYAEKPNSCEELTECPEYTLSEDGLSYGTTIKYGCKKCKEGWHMDEKGGCDIDACDQSFNLEECPINSDCEECTSGSVTKYKIKNCKEGFESVNGKCVAKCADNETRDENGSCVSAKLTCNVGDIFYSNKTCSPDVIPGRTPIGVVYYVGNDGNDIRIVGLRDIDKSGKELARNSAPVLWRNTFGGEKTCKYKEHRLSKKESLTVGGYKDRNGVMLKDEMSGHHNTYTCSDMFYPYPHYKKSQHNPVTAVYAYAPSVCAEGSFCAKGNWYQPAFGEMYIMSQDAKVDGPISKALAAMDKDSPFSDKKGVAVYYPYYTSSLTDTDGSARISLFDFRTQFNRTISGTVGGYVRPVLQIDLCREAGQDGFDTQKGKCVKCGTNAFFDETRNKCACSIGYDMKDGNCVRHKYNIGDIVSYNGEYIGAVFYDDGKKTKLISMQYADGGGDSGAKNLMFIGQMFTNWGYEDDISSQPKFADVAKAKTDANGKKNTDALLKSLKYFSAAGKVENYNPPYLCKTDKTECWGSGYVPRYSPAGDACNTLQSNCQNGLWYLPSLAEVQMIYDNWKDNGPLKRVSVKNPLFHAVKKSNSGIEETPWPWWSSTEKDNANVWTLDFKTGEIKAQNKEHGEGVVRPCLEF